MATELAKAYVQIIPSAKGIKGQITSELGGEAKSAGESSGNSFAGTFKKILAAAGIGAAFKSSLMEGADLQQSIGGIETLFKGSADTVKAYADDAFKSAGLSANEYMETATGFAASLLQGLGGDTAKAAEMTDMAITDMADNANKMGTSMESIQNAYQGFAKQNYTMLDNLKLGYGGTKEEMERLLADAQKLSGVEYDISNLADVYSAIHVIQEDLDITGTTAKEAAETFTGSLAAMKSAGKNLLGNLSLGEDIGPSLQALNDTVFTFVKGNLLPMVGNVLKGIPQLLRTTLGTAMRGINLIASNTDAIVQQGVEIVSELASGVISAAPYLVESGVKLLAGLGESLLSFDWAGAASSLIAELRDNMDTAAGEILGTDGNILQSVLDAITLNLPKLLSGGVGIVTNILNGILANLPGLITGAGAIINTLLSFIMTAAPGLLSAGVELIDNIVSGIAENLPAIIEAAVGVVSQLLTTISENGPAMLEQGVSLISDLASGLIQNLPAILDAIIAGLDQLLTIISDNGPAMLSSGISLVSQMASGLIQNIPSLVSAIAGGLASLIATIAKHLPQLLSSGIQLIGQMAAGLIQAIPQAVAAIPKIISGIVSAFRQFEWLSIGGDIIRGVASGISGAASAIGKALLDAAKNAWSSVKSFFGIASPSKLMANTIGKFIPPGIAVGIEGNMGPLTDTMKGLAKTTVDAWNTDALQNASYTTKSQSASAARNIELKIYPSDGMDEKALADLVIERLSRLIKQGEMALA